MQIARNSPAPSGRHKNVLFLMSDQHKPRALSIDADPVAQTPRLDAFARTCLRFQHAYCTDPICGPSRASIWTGLYTHNHGIYQNEIPWPFGLKSIADSFHRAGYITGAIGKMHFADANAHGFEYRLDFNDWYQYLGPKAKIFASEVGRPFPGDGHPQIASLWRSSGDPWSGQYEKDGRKGMTHVGHVSQLAEEHHFESFVAREAIQFLRRCNRDQPFFLVSSFLKPHQPFMPAERFARMFRAEDMRVPRSFGTVDLDTVPRHIRKRIQENPLTPELKDPNYAKQRIAFYHACLTQMDDCVGQVLDGLRELGLEKDTIVVYASDHGELLGEHGLWQKFVFYESSIGVPLMFRVPGMTAGGATCDTIVSLAQVAPTLAELCDVPSLGRYDAPSLIPQLRNPGAASDQPIFAEFDLNTPHPKFMIRRGDWKFCHYVDDMPELYNVRTDSDEMHNLALNSNYSTRVAQMKSELFGWLGPAAPMR